MNKMCYSIQIKELRKSQVDLKILVNDEVSWQSKSDIIMILNKIIKRLIENLEKASK